MKFFSNIRNRFGGRQNSLYSFLQQFLSLRDFDIIKISKFQTKYICGAQFNSIKPGGRKGWGGGRGGHFCLSKFKFELFLDGLWYEPEAL